MRVLTRWTVTRPDGKVWRRRFATEGAAWRVLVPGATPVLFRQRRAAMVRAGWKVMLDTPAAIG